MLITSGLSPASGELLDDSSDLNNVYNDSADIYSANFGRDDFNNMVPESSHTVEIEYVCDHSETDEAFNKTLLTDKIISSIVDTDPVSNADSYHSQIQNQYDNVTSTFRASSTEMDTNEPDLTNLTWLQNITNIMSVPSLSFAPVSPDPRAKPQPQNTRLQKLNKTIEKCQEDFKKNSHLYQSSADKKPPFSYSTLICMAMRYNSNKMTLSAIYTWIKDNFKYYRNADPTWQNSIRHNLSLNKVFVKVARSKQEPGKGGFWKLELGRLEDGKRNSNTSKSHRKKKSIKQEVNKGQLDSAKESIKLLISDNIPQGNTQSSDYEEPDLCTSHMADFSLDDTLANPLVNISIDNEIGANVIVEPAMPPPLLPEEDLATLLLSPTDWDDLQLEMLDSMLDSCFK